MNGKALFLCAMLVGCGAPSDRLTDEQATAQQQAEIEEPQEIEVPEPTSTPPPASPPPAYRAFGTEPGWTLNVTPTAMQYEGDYGAVVIDEPTPARFRPAAGRYGGKRLSVTIVAGPCNDGMSDRSYRDTVTVVADGNSVSGCGGGLIADTPDAEPEPGDVLAANTN